MRTVYRKEVLGELTITEASSISSFYGLCCNFTIAVYTTNTHLGIRLEFHPSFNEGSKIPGCSFSNFVRFSEGSGGNRRNVVQEVIVKDLIVEAYSLQDVTQADEAVAREISQNVLRNFSGIIEYERKQILSSFASSIRNKASAALDSQYSRYTQDTVKKLLSSLNWDLLVSTCPGPDRLRQIISFVLSNSNPVFYPLVSDGDKEALDVTPKEEEIPEIERVLARIKWEMEREANAARYAQLQAEYAAANQEKEKESAAAATRAETLLKLVCGNRLFEEYLVTHKIVVENKGWVFTIPARGWIECSDPKGNTGNLCIHTVNLSCNPIDEMVIAYLHIKHKMEEFFRVAIVHGHSPGFSLAEFKSEKKPKQKA